MTHTPGPWTEGKTVLVKGACFLSTPHWESEEAIANARLIAASPDLLAAAEELLRIGIINPTGSHKLSIAIDGLKEAVARARGSE